MNIQQSIIHRIAKERDSSGAESIEINVRNETLPLDGRLIKLGADVLKLYGTLSNGYGTLGDDLDIHRFPKYLTDYSSIHNDFITLASKTLNLIAESMSQQRLTTTSYPIFFKYENQGREWLLIAMLKLKEGVGIDEETLDLNDSLIFDINNLREAARIDIGMWLNNEQPYLSFIKRGSGADAESSKYFRNALSCLEYTDAKFNTDTALRAVDDYCENQDWSPEKRQATRARVFEYCKTKKDANEPVNLTALSSVINDLAPDSFVNFVRANEYPVSETFSPHPDSYKKLQHLAKRFGTISLGFDVDDLVSERVYYNETEESIVVCNPPLDLVAQIQKVIGGISNNSE